MRRRRLAVVVVVVNLCVRSVRAVVLMVNGVMLVR